MKCLQLLRKSITRYEMARIMVRVNEMIQGESKVSVAGVDTVMADYNQVPQEYRYYVE